MATPGYAEDLQPSQPQGGGIAPVKGGQQKAPPVAPPFLSELHSSSSSSPSQTSASAQVRQTTPPVGHNKVVLATPSQVATTSSQYVVSDIQSAVSQSSNGQNAAQFIVVTVSEGSLHSNDSLSDSSSPPTAQTGVPTHVVQQVQTAQVQSVPFKSESPECVITVPHQQRSVVQTTTKSQNNQLGVGNLHITPEISQVGPHVFPNQVQYVDGDNNYNSTSIRSSSYPYTESAIYSQTTAAAQYYSEPSSTTGPVSQVSTPVTSQPVTTGNSVGVTAASGVSSYGTGAAGGGTGGAGTGCYVVPAGYMMGGPTQNPTHNIRASPATLQWLFENYETAEGVSLPRSTLYCHYLLHCENTKLEPVNAASFGKLIRSLFVGLRTRRLGTRGNSKYHYYGLRIKASSPLHKLMEDQQYLAMRQQPYSHKNRIRPVQKVEGMTNGMGIGSGQGAGVIDISSQVQQYQQFMNVSRSLPEFPELDLQDKTLLPEGILPEHIRAFQQLYREHCEAIVDVIVNLQFPLVETLWKTFWRFSEGQTSGMDPLDLPGESQKHLPKDSLVLLCKYEPVLRWSRNCDNVLYQTLVEILIPDVLTPIPSALTQAIRNCAKSLETWLTGAMMNIPEEMVRIKVVCAAAFAQTLRRYTSLNHLAQAARAVLQNSAQITQMLSDLNRVDFNNVQEQASWVCACEERTVQSIEQDFKVTLQHQQSLEQWAAWLDGVVSHVLEPYTSSPGFTKAAKLFLLKWSFYSSMVIRDLTLRSAASFGSFHLIRLLYDAYMYYLVEHRVAKAKGETPIAVMGEFSNLNRNLSTTDPDKEEEEEEDDESDEDQMSVTANSSVLGDVSLEPPAKLARTDLFNSTHN